MTDHTKPQTLNPIPVGTRVMVVKAEFIDEQIEVTA